MVSGFAKRLVVVSAICGLLHAASFPYREVRPDYKYSFPRDHFEHEDFRTEWWYYTGNVMSAEGARYGFELVFFRNGERHDATTKSAWNLQHGYLAHAALTDVNGKRFSYEERLNRQGPGVAGASFAEKKIWNGNWSVVWNGETQTLRAVAPEFQFQLKLEPEKAFVIHGENGVSQKSEGLGSASHYVSFPRMRVSGEITAGGKVNKVAGQAWMDHEWFSQYMAQDQTGWDWFSIQLDDHTELMLVQLRRKDPKLPPYTFGTFVGADGKSRHLKSTEFQLTPVAKAGVYPIEWRIQVPSAHLDLKCKAVLPNQELKARQGGVSYWEGAVDYSGSRKGYGYLEMTGYNSTLKL